MKVPAYAAPAARAPLAPFTVDRREPGPGDVQMDILFCGVCHSDLHTAKSEWPGSVYPVVPGHEILGRVRPRFIRRAEERGRPAAGDRRRVPRAKPGELFGAHQDSEARLEQGGFRLTQTGSRCILPGMKTAGRLLLSLAPSLIAFLVTGVMWLTDGGIVRSDGMNGRTVVPGMFYAVFLAMSLLATIEAGCMRVRATPALSLAVRGWTWFLVAMLGLWAAWMFYDPGSLSSQASHVYWDTQICLAVPPLQFVHACVMLSIMDAAKLTPITELFED
jgi:hypothetical protein